MKPKSQDSTAFELFQAHFNQILNPDHPLIQLAGQIDWARFDAAFADSYRDDLGAPGKPTMNARSCGRRRKPGRLLLCSSHARPPPEQHTAVNLPIQPDSTYEHPVSASYQSTGNTSQICSLILCQSSSGVIQPVGTLFNDVGSAVRTIS
ncbi:MAG: hypothetical protein GXP29_08815 [Planctomycetes bacterium]|nr:hypothetical protein [Planctomycetota bacterium]